MTTTLRNILGDRPVHSLPRDATVARAARMMTENRVGALVVLDGDTLVGIVTERDVVFRCVGVDRRPDTTTVADIMTADPVTIDINDAVSNALAAKLGNNFRHLPVMENGRIAGLLSFRDIPAEYVMLYERFREMTMSRADS
ncbi:MAG: hypothetical protein CSA70_05715 [Rhodobacterales bacterium]|nr:MAG: hypothetical protein CSA70_05715 [Rhodobacterales bacterium]